MFEADLHSGSSQPLVFDVLVALVMLRMSVLYIGEVDPGWASPAHTEFTLH